MADPATDGSARVPTAEPLLELGFRSIPDRLKLVRAGVRAAVQATGFDRAATDDIVLAVDEACANVIIHVYDRRPDGDISLKIFRLGDGIRIVLRDYGPPAASFRIKPRDLDDVSPGGLGTHFIREIMDDVRHFPAPDGAGNILELSKRLSEPL